jgi:hypothetical protein
MKEPGDESPDIESIRADASAPTNVVENLAQHEAEAYGKNKPRRTPTELHHAAVERHLAEVGRQCAKFENQVEQRDTEIRALRSEFAWLNPEHARLAESYNNLVYNNAISSALVAIGGVTVSVATATSYPVAFSSIGISVFVAGIISQAFHLVRGKWFTGPRRAPAYDSDRGPSGSASKRPGTCRRQQSADRSWRSRTG